MCLWKKILTDFNHKGLDVFFSESTRHILWWVKRRGYSNVYIDFRSPDIYHHWIDVVTNFIYTVLTEGSREYPCGKFGCNLDFRVTRSKSTKGYRGSTVQLGYPTESIAPAPPYPPTSTVEFRSVVGWSDKVFCVLKKSETEVFPWIRGFSNQNRSTQLSLTDDLNPRLSQSQTINLVRIYWRDS